MDYTTNHLHLLVQLDNLLVRLDISGILIAVFKCTECTNVSSWGIVPQFSSVIL